MAFYISSRTNARLLECIVLQPAVSRPSQVAELDDGQSQSQIVPSVSVNRVTNEDANVSTQQTADLEHQQTTLFEESVEPLPATDPGGQRLNNTQMVSSGHYCTYAMQVHV